MWVPLINETVSWLRIIQITAVRPSNLNIYHWNLHLHCFWTCQLELAHCLKSRDNSTINLKHFCSVGPASC